jgi:hypothetical protein
MRRRKQLEKAERDAEIEGILWEEGGNAEEKIQ